MFDQVNFQEKINVMSATLISLSKCCALLEGGGTKMNRCDIQITKTDELSCCTLNSKFLLKMMRTF